LVGFSPTIKPLWAGRLLFLAIFAVMKKSLITYLIIVCSICLHLTGFASPVKANRTTATLKSSYTTSPRAFTFKKAGQDLTDCLPCNTSHIVLHYGSVQVLYPVESYFTAEPNFFFKSSDHFPAEPIRKKDVKRILKDHLLHLFPSHYFW
jgi:hypothetical protein